jgi:hypothetical protein
MASSTLRHDDRMPVRRALLTAVRRPMTRLAFFADFVFAMSRVFQQDSFGEEAAGNSLGASRRQMFSGF